MYLNILKEHLGVIERFYNSAAEPFETRMRKIDAGESRLSHGARLAMMMAPNIWLNGVMPSEGLAVLRSCSLGLLEKALHDYLREFVGPGLKKSKESWFDQHCRLEGADEKIICGQCGHHFSKYLTIGPECLYGLDKAER